MIRYGENKILRLAMQFRINERQVLNGMRCLIDNKSKHADIQCLLTCIKTIPCSSVECERDFSVMNVIVSDLRPSLTVENTTSLTFVNINGPPLACRQPENCVKSLLMCHRFSTATVTNWKEFFNWWSPNDAKYFNPLAAVFSATLRWAWSSFFTNLHLGQTFFFNVYCLAWTFFLDTHVFRVENLTSAPIHSTGLVCIHHL